jgi:hypothetical protein
LYRLYLYGTVLSNLLLCCGVALLSAAPVRVSQLGLWWPEGASCRASTMQETDGHSLR